VRKATSQARRILAFLALKAAVPQRLLPLDCSDDCFRPEGEGLVVVKQGTINGGDPGYVSVGTFTLKGSALTGLLNVRKWNQSATSVFGPLNNFDLQLNGQSADPTSFSASGGIPSQPGLTIKIVGKFISPAA
jgi:hypothetical protein